MAAVEEQEMIDVLGVIDMQIDFLTGSLANKAAVAIIDKVKQEIKDWDGAIFYTKDTHGPDFKETLEGSLPEHCIRFTEGWNYPEDIQKLLDEKNAKCIEKITFGFIHWAKDILDVASDDQAALAALAKKRIRKIRLVGTCTGICVISNALILRALFKDTPIEIVGSACACINDETHKAALTIASLCGITVI